MVTGQKNICVPKIGLKCPASLINFIFLPEENVSDVGGGCRPRPQTTPPSPPKGPQAIAWLCVRAPPPPAALDHPLLPTLALHLGVIHKYQE